MEKKEEDEIREQMQKYMNIATDMAVQMLENEQLPKALAVYSERLCAELCSKGFSRKEAIQIICALQIPAAKSK